MKKLPMGLLAGLLVGSARKSCLILLAAFLSIGMLAGSGFSSQLVELSEEEKREDDKTLREEFERIDRNKCVPLREMIRAENILKGAPFPIGFSTLSYSATSGSTLPFAASSGTSGCGEKETAYMEQRHFVAATMDNLSHDIARGGGEHLQSLSILLGCPAPAYSDLATMTRQNYEQLFPSAETGAGVFLTRLKDIMKDHPGLAGRCVHA